MKLSHVFLVALVAATVCLYASNHVPMYSNIVS
jgi:hypothetical protein